MRLSIRFLACAALVAACTDTPRSPVGVTDRMLEASAVSGPGMLTLCHVDGLGRARPLTLAASAESAHLAHGDNVLIGSWSGIWYVNGVPRISMAVQFRDDCGGFSAGAPVASVDYGAGFCIGDWSYEGPSSPGHVVLESISVGPCVDDFQLEILYDPATGAMRANPVDPRYWNQYGIVFRDP